MKKSGKEKMRRWTSMQWLVVIVLALFVSACASIGRPEGGPRDETPPVMVSSNPAVGALNVSRNQIDIYFDENVQLQDAFNKLIVSPVQKNTPRATANGRHVRVTLNDTLLPNTTYTLDFADAIKDLNEGNILDGFATYFSTGDSIDSLAISGMVLEARTLEPAQGMLVGVYSNLSDTAISTLPLERVARTNQYGQFSILNLKPGKYRVYALNDINRDYFWDSSEDVAFYDLLVEPRAEDITVTDTLRASNGNDSLVERAGVAYLPNDILLTWFNEGKKSVAIGKDNKRDSRRKLSFTMTAPTDSLPEITIVEGPLAGYDIRDWAILDVNPTLDSLTYWIKDTAVLAIDSLYLSIKHRHTIDSTKMLSWRTDTMKFFYKEPKKKSSKKEEEIDTLPPQLTFVNIRAITNQRQDVNKPVIFGIDQPIDTILESGIHLEMLKDTLWVPVKGVELTTDSLSPLFNRYIYQKWSPGEKYRLRVDSAAVVGIYDEWNKDFTHEFTVRELEEYAGLNFKVVGTDSAVLVELLDKGDKVVRTAPVVDGMAKFEFLEPETYYARLYIDANRNGKWDTGILDSIQPEEVSYYPGKIKLRKYSTIEQTWNIYETPVDKQKHYDIKKNKPKLKKGEQAPNYYDDEEEEEDEFGNSFYDPNNSYNNARRNNNNRNNNNRNNRSGSNRNTNALGTMPRMR